MFAGVSFGLDNNFADIDACMEALQAITRGEYRRRYHQDLASGQFHPESRQVDFDAYQARKAGGQG
jgi:hypothetical protein